MRSRVRGAYVRVKGVVQGVGFRPFVYRIAYRWGLNGYVRNLGGGDVEVYVEGTRKSIEGFLRSLGKEKPPIAVIEDVSVSWTKPKGVEGFKILESRTGSSTTSIIPPDIAICKSCLRELRDPSDRRYRYFFITCTDCGPRFTVIEKLPYDRENTSMRFFEMCRDCREEYLNPLNRRFHAQTVACPRCGPRVYLTDRTGVEVDCSDPILEAGKLIDEGFIVAVKGYGGFHLASATTFDEPLRKLRERKGRESKPFAVMARDIESVRSFAEVSEEEEKLLESYIHPIILLRKRRDYYLSELVAPGLHLVGVMLPYTGLHILLFDGTREPALVMTSGNISGQPIVKDDGEAVARLGKLADYILFHDRPIVQRCDDSVVKLVDGEPTPVRRSRGYTPTPVELDLEWRGDGGVLGLGGEENVTACIVKGRKAYLTQHIGDVDNVETLTFLRDAVKHMGNLLSVKFDLVVCDLHPKFSTSILAEKLSVQAGIPLLKVQHHVAHAYSLLAESRVDEAVVIAADGFGYGLDGGAWGGEVFYVGSGGWRRLGHLEEHPMVGGDLATRYPVRMVAGILRGYPGVEEWLRERSSKLPYGERELRIIERQLERGIYPVTSSCGRVLDAVSALLDVCFERTYEGEPAMKLEAAAYGGEDVLKIEPRLRGDTVETRVMLERIFDCLGRFSRRNLAYSAHIYLARGLASYAVEKALELGVEHVGFTGGVAFNTIFSREIKRIIEENGLRFLRHRVVPPGDGGLSLGQVYYALTYAVKTSLVEA